MSEGKVCRTCRHWQRVEADIGMDQFEITVIQVGHPLRWEEMGRCHAQEAKVEILAMEARHPLTREGYTCPMYAPRDG